MRLGEAGKMVAIAAMAAALAACSKKVPNVVGMSQPDAVEALKKVKLEAKVTEVHGRGAAGKVVEQDPAAGTKPTGASVALMIEAAGTGGGSASNNTPAGVTVPELTGKTLAEAEAALAGVGLVRGNIRLAANDKTPGTVFDEDPHAGTQTQAGATVDLSIATGTLPVAVPASIMGQSQAAAEQMLRDAGFQVAPATQDTKPDNAANGTVVGANPSVGVQVAKGTPVSLVIKQPSVTVPHVVTLAQDSAKVRLMEIGLVPVVNTVFDPNGPEGVVTWQSMDGVPVAKGASVGIRVSTRVRRILFPYQVFQSTAIKQAVTADQMKLFRK